MDTKKNYWVELLRFLFCALIVLHHAGHIVGERMNLVPSGGLVADAFFMLTGYFAFRHMEKRCFCRTIGSFDTDTVQNINIMYEMEDPAQYSVKYTLQKIGRAYPYIVSGTVISYIPEIYYTLRMGELTFRRVIDFLYDFLIEVLLLPLTGLLHNGQITMANYRNAPMWYMSALLLALPVMMYLVLRWRNVFKYWLVWFIPPIVQTWMTRDFTGILSWADFIGPVNIGVVRAFCSILMGGMVWYASEWMSRRFSNQKKKTVQRRVAVTILELFLLGYFLVSVTLGVEEGNEVCFLYVIAAALTLSFSGISYTSSMWKAKIFGYFGKLSLPIYCVHWGVYKWVAIITQKIGITQVWIAIGVVFAVCILISAGLMALFNKLECRLTQINDNRN